MVKVLLLALVIGMTDSPAARAQPPSRCRMAPALLALKFPDRGLVWQEGEEDQGPCEKVPRRAWVRRSSGVSPDLFVHPDGPNGSGRYWTVTVGTAGKQQRVPGRGFCLSTSTVGWRTLQRFGRPLAWVDDGDGDGRPELILWTSFSLVDEPSMAEFGLVAWVYELDARGTLAIDWDLSRKLARELALAYRSTLEEGGGNQPSRDRAAEELEAFAEGRCTASGEANR
jgi:hypothetical protein